MIERAATTIEIQRIVDATPNNDPEQAIRAIRSAELRGYGAGARKAPAQINWFRTVVVNFFHEMEQHQSPPIAKGWLPDDEFGRLSNVLDNPDDLSAGGCRWRQ